MSISSSVLENLCDREDPFSELWVAMALIIANVLSWHTLHLLVADWISVPVTLVVKHLLENMEALHLFVEPHVILAAQ